ncbi:MAG: hypothetical protein JXA89_23080, partial [Anaerolineae bacterium]|nr:hypothetical protein [Anaerolineae bacterium]
NGFVEPIALALEGAPAGATVSFDPNPAVPPGSSRLAIETAVSAPTGVYSMTVAGSTGALTATAGIDLVVASLTTSFTLDISPTIRTAKPGEAVSYTVVLSGVNGFSQPVNLDVVGIGNAGVKAAWSSSPVVPGGSSTLTLSVLPHPLFGDHTLQVVGLFEAQVTAAPIELAIDYPYKVYLALVLK